LISALMVLGAFAQQAVACALIAAVNGARVLLVPCFMIATIARSSVRVILSKILGRDTTLAKDDGSYGYCNQGSKLQGFRAPLGRLWLLG